MASTGTFEKREIVAKGMILCGGLKIGPVPLWRGQNDSLDCEFQIVDVHYTDPKESRFTPRKGV